jgi:hypothetical protein
MKPMDVSIVKDLTDRTPRRTRKFRLDPDLFECAAKLPAGVVQDLALMRRTAKAAREALDAGNDELAEEIAAEAQRIFFGILDIIMLPESTERFAKRMRDPLNPIDMPDIQRFMAWTVEEYGDRPTTPSSDSVPSPSSNGTSSTDGALPAPPIPASSL